MNKKNIPHNQKCKLIYNPHAGTKRKLFPNPKTITTSLEEIKNYLAKYQIEADFYPTEYPGHATELARDAAKEGYKTVLIAGGDGTVGEAANGIIGSNTTLGILPLGSFMNVARMLSIPLDIEKAIMLIKINRTRKIDVGAITTLSGKKLETPYIFLESVGLGLEAQVHQNLIDIEQGNWRSIITLLKTIFEYFNHKAEVQLDNQTVRTRATMINISNGPYSGPAIPMAPEAKLNDHLLTVTVFKMTKFNLFFYFSRIWFGFKRKRKPTTYQTKKVKIFTRIPRPVHADARVYGQTPLEIETIPNAISVYTGFSNPSDTIVSLKKRTILDP